MLWGACKLVFSGRTFFWTPFCPILAPRHLLGHFAFKRSPGGKILTSRVLAPPNPFQCIQNVFGTKNECFGVLVSMFLVDVPPFGPHFAPFWPPRPLLGHFAFKWSRGGKILTSQVLWPPNPLHCILNVFGTKSECFGVPVSMFSVDAHLFGPHFAPFWPPGSLLCHVAFKRSRGGKNLTSRVLGPPNPFECILNVFGTTSECFGVPVSMFLVDAHPFGPYLPHFGPPWPLLGHVAFKQSPEVNFSQDGSRGLPTHSSSSKMCLGPQVNALGCL